MPASLKAMITKGSPSLITWLVLCGGLYLTSLYNYTLFHSHCRNLLHRHRLFPLPDRLEHPAPDEKQLYPLPRYRLAVCRHHRFCPHPGLIRGWGFFRDSMPTCPRSYGSSPATCRACRSWRHPGSSIGSSIPEPRFGVYLLVTLLLSAAGFSGKFFPDCFVEGTGLTPFKIASEYLICGILVGRPASAGTPPGGVRSAHPAVARLVDPLHHRFGTGLHRLRQRLWPVESDRPLLQDIRLLSCL